MAQARVGSKMSVRVEDVRPQYAECPSCQKEYDDMVHVPRVLPCLHALCVSCLEGTASRGSLKCSTCDLRHSIPNGDVDLFRVDQTRQYLVNHLKIQKKNPEIICQECNNRNKLAKNRCRECAQFLCIDCVDAHRRTKVTKQHNLIAIEELRQAPLDDFQQPQTCPVQGHTDQPFAFFCASESCDKPVCALCAVADHTESKGHDIRDIHEVYGEVKRSVETLMSDVKHRTLSAHDTAAAIENTMERLSDNVKQSIDNIDAAFDNAIRAIERRRVELKDKAHARAKDKKKRLDTQLDSVTYHINCMEDANEFAANLSMYGTEEEFLFSKETTIERLSNLKAEEFDTIPHDNEEVKFKATLLAEDFNKHARKLGDVWTTSAYGPNTHVQVCDVGMDRDQTIMNITLFDSDGLQQSEGGVDLRVDVTEPSGRRRPAAVDDVTPDNGRYKARFTGTSKGKHRATVFLYGNPLPNDHVFRVQSPTTIVDRLNLTDKYPRDKHHEMQSSRSLQTATPSDMSDEMSPITDQRLGDVTCPGFVFDATTAHASVDINDEGKTMKIKANKGGTTRRSQNPRQQGRFAIYRGAMASRPIQKAGLYYFEVGVVYKIHTYVRQEQVFEIGLAKLDCIDKHPSVDCHPYAWSVSGRGCHVCGKVCLQTWHNGQLLSHTPISPRTKTPAGQFNRLYYGFLLDAERRHWIIIDVKNKKKMFQFKNLVVSEMSEPLWPVFAVTPSEAVTAALTLKTGRSIDSVPPEALEALSL